MVDAMVRASGGEGSAGLWKRPYKGIDLKLILEVVVEEGEIDHQKLETIVKLSLWEVGGYPKGIEGSVKNSLASYVVTDTLLLAATTGGT
jgi:hypothetical protein